MKIDGKFEIKSVTPFSDIADGKITNIQESDLAFQDDKNIYQFVYIKPDEDKKYEIKPGIFMIGASNAGIVLNKVELRERNLLETAANTTSIMNEAKLFFRKLDVYERLGRAKKRGVLLYSKPGLGKTSTIERFCQISVAEEPGTVVMIWPTSAIDADDITKFLSVSSEYTPECKRLILVIEDIGGREREGSHGRAPVDSGLLNLLDGVGVAFKLPTFIIATTNHAENLMQALADRPERFDLTIRLSPPNHAEKIALTEFIAKRSLTDDEKDALGMKGSEEFSIAHLGEIVVRAELHEKSFRQVIEELVEHSKLFKKDFEEKETRMGINLWD